MKSDHKAKQKGSSPSHKKKLKRKYRNDRSKRKQGSSSATSSDEELSLSSDEYSSPKEESLKKVKHRQQTSVSSSRSPSPGKIKKKTKSKDKEKCRKKKCSYSSESDLSSEELVKVRSDKKERKKRSPSPMKSKRKSLSPRRDRGRSSSPKRTKRKSNISPHCSKGKKSSETSSKQSKHSKSKRSLSRERKDSPLPIKSPPPKKVHGPALPSVHLNIKSPSSTDPVLKIGSKNIGKGNKQNPSPIKEEKEIPSEFRKKISPSLDESPMDDIQMKLMPKTNKESRLSLSLPTKEFRPLTSNITTSITVKKEDKLRLSSSTKNSFAFRDRVSPVNKEASATSEVGNLKQSLPNASRNISMLKKGTIQIKGNEKTNNNLIQDGENISSPSFLKKGIDKKKSYIASYEKIESLNLSPKSILNADTKGDKNTPALIESDKNLSPLISKPGAPSKLDTSSVMNDERSHMKDSKVKFSPLTNRKLISSKILDDNGATVQTGTSLSAKDGNSTVSIAISGMSILSTTVKDTEDLKSPQKMEATQELKDSRNLAHLKEKNGTENEKVGNKTKHSEILIKKEEVTTDSFLPSVKLERESFSKSNSNVNDKNEDIKKDVKNEDNRKEDDKKEDNKKEDDKKEDDKKEDDKKEDDKKEDDKKKENKKEENKKEENKKEDNKKEDIKKEDIKITSSTLKSKPPVLIKKITIASTKRTTTSSVLTATTGEKGDSPLLSKKVNPMISQKSKKSSPRRSSKSPSPRSRRRSRSPRKDRKRSRSRSPVRYRDKQRRRSISPDRRRDRDRSRSPDRKRKVERRRDDDKKDRDEKDRKRGREERSKESKKDDSEKKTNKGDNSPDKKDINELEEEMKKRKERIEAWRNANKTKSKGSIELMEEEPIETNVTKKADKKWSLEDDDSEDEVTGKVNAKKEAKKEESKENEDDDPLDMFMKSIDAEVNKISGRNTSEPAINSENKTKTITVVKTISTVKPVEPKPEVIEQNQDALEYSSEEEDKTDITASDFADQTKRKKELTVADHTKIYYAPFRRDFYVEVPELVRLSSDEVKIMRDSMGDIQVRGRSIPKPIKSWAQAGHSPKVMSVLKKFEYEKPTPIQAQALPVIMSGRDMIGIAKTGSGKTLAFLLPMFRHVLDQPALDEDDGPISIIMAPTRELALQIYREAKKFCKVLNINVTCIYGGSGISEQIAELKKGTEIIVCTPGRMIDMLAANNGRVTNCRRCTFLVLDEADRMFDMGFEPQVMRIIGNIRPDRQTVLFSATFPRQMEAVARKVLTKPIEVQVGGRSIVCSDVEQHAIVIEEDNKFLKVLELLGVYQVSSSILLFVERQDTADLLLKDLLRKGYPCLSLHGGMDQFDRDSTIADFKNGVSKLMVSTSVAARGLDVKNLNVVVNYDCPNHYEDYVHRVGRTGRAGNKGMAFTLITPEQGRSAGDVIKAFELAGSSPPEDLVLLWNNFKADMEKEGKTIKMNSGFTGTKGFKFNAEEDAMVNESKKIRKFTLGLQDSDEEAEAADDAIEKIEADLEKAFSSKPKVALQPEVAEGQKTKIAENNIDKDKLKQASSIAAIINKKLSSGQVVDRNTAATAHIMQGGALESLTGVGLAKQLADKVNAKLNYKAAEVEAPAEEKQIAVRYEEEIDINDFPQQARWRITSKEIIEQVREVSEAGVTVRGLYIPPNKKPNEDERRLHLYIESLSERSIQIAKAEIKRLLKEELLKSENSYRPAQPTGRYKVL